MYSASTDPSIIFSADLKIDHEPTEDTMPFVRHLTLEEIQSDLGKVGPHAEALRDLMIEIVEHLIQNEGRHADRLSEAAL